jgi:hypothetical protein
MQLGGVHFLVAMKVFVLLLKTLSDWVADKQEARDFRNCTPAINFCVERRRTTVS